MNASTLTGLYGADVSGPLGAMRLVPQHTVVDASDEADYQEWQREILKIERAVAKNGSRDLDVLVKAGVDREVLLKLLAVAANGNHGPMKKLMRTRRDALRSLSKRLDALADEAEKLADDPLSVVQFWAHLEGGWGVLGMKPPKPMSDDPCLPLVFTGMRVFAKKVRRQATLFSNYLRAYSRRDKGVVLLLIHVWMSRPTQMGIKKSATGHVRFHLDCLEELARLLTDAFEAAGKQGKSRFSADGLRQIFKRHCKPLIVQWLKWNLPTPPSSRVSTPPVTTPNSPILRS